VSPKVLPFIFLFFFPKTEKNPNSCNNINYT
jgi:hypothetical protein